VVDLAERDAFGMEPVADLLQKHIYALCYLLDARSLSG
jgi:hypothetical protein